MKRKPTYNMEERIGYGLSFKEAMDLLAEKSPANVTHIHVRTAGYETYWAELRNDGWRVYIPRSSCQTARTKQ